MHFDTPIGNKNQLARHYLGYAKNLNNRIKEHKNGTSGARLMEVCHERKVTFQLARVWPDGNKDLERKLKRRKNAPLLCPICSGEHANKRGNYHAH